MEFLIYLGTLAFEHVFDIGLHAMKYLSFF